MIPVNWRRPNSGDLRLWGKTWRLKRRTNDSASFVLAQEIMKISLCIDVPAKILTWPEIFDMMPYLLDFP
jgi:hypothetical protein